MLKLTNLEYLTALKLDNLASVKGGTSLDSIELEIEIHIDEIDIDQELKSDTDIDFIFSYNYWLELDRSDLRGEADIAVVTTTSLGI